MTEYAFDLAGEFGSPSLNGHQDEPEVVSDNAPAETTPVAHVDPTRGVFITSRGDEVHLTGKRINSLVLERISNDGKPRIPMVEVTLVGKHKQLEAHPHDEGYLALLAEWEEGRRVLVLRYLFLMGVKDEPDQEFIDDQRQFFPNASAADMKYLYIASLIPDDDIDTFMEAVMGQTMATQKGLETSANFTESP